MSTPYNDPYYDAQTKQNQPYQPPYRDAQDYDPYSNQQRHPTYDAAGYTDEYVYPARTTETAGQKERSRYEDAGFPPALRPPKSTGALRLWRLDHQGKIWTKGGRGRCIGRFCCCSLLIALFLLVSIVLTLLIWVRPPNVQVNNVGFPTTGSAFQVTQDSLNLNLGVNISVDNPNYFAVAFRRLKADLTYPVNNMDVGGGEKENIVFHANTQTSFSFPLTLTYEVANDPNRVVLTDLLTRCGILGGQKTNVVVRYRITLGIKVVFVTISPSFSNTFSFECPITQQDVADLLRGSGISIPGLSG